jgi:hypothetical protein
MGVVKKSGFKGFVTNWDMFMRNLEGDARKNLNAVAIHTYHAHPNRAPLPAGWTIGAEPVPNGNGWAMWIRLTVRCSVV